MNQLISIIGGGGFIGRYVVQQLAETGVRLRIGGRDPEHMAYLKPLGALGQIQLVPCDIRSPASVAALLDGADAAVNLVGVLRGDFDALQKQGAELFAQCAARAGVHSLVHVSAIGADSESDSAYGRSKGEGEEAVRAAFPQATIVRPSIVFGPEDQFTNRFANLGRAVPLAMPVVAPRTKFQPVYVKDVAQAIVTALTHPAQHAGKTYALGGPRVYDFHQLIATILHEAQTERTLVDVPDFISCTMATLGGWLPFAPITRDQWLMLQQDNVIGTQEDGLAAMGISATPLEAVASTWLTRFRPQGRFTKRTA